MIEAPIARGGHEDRRPSAASAARQPGDDAEEDDDLAELVEGRVHERAELAGLAGRAGQRAVEHVEDAADEDDEAADDPGLQRRRGWRPTVVIAKPMSVSPFGVRPMRPMASAIGSKIFLMRRRGIRWRWSSASAAADAEDGALARGELARTPPRGGGRSSRGPGAGSRRRRPPGGGRGATTTSGWREPTWAMSSRDGRLALGQPADDAQAVHVGHDLVERAQLAQVVGLGDGRGDGAADSGGGGGQGVDSGWGWCVVAHQPRFISIAVDARTMGAPMSSRRGRLRPGWT